MAEEFAELGLEAAGPLIDRGDKMYEPAKQRAKDAARKAREKIQSPTQGGFDRNGSDDDDYYDRPRRRNTQRDRDRGRGNYEEEYYERKVTGPRAKSAGRDGYAGGGGRGLDRDRRCDYTPDGRGRITNDCQPDDTIPHRTRNPLQNP